MQRNLLESKGNETNRIINIVRSPLKNSIFSFFDIHTLARIATVSKDFEGPSRENYFKNALASLRNFIRHPSISGVILLENCQVEQTFYKQFEYRNPKQITTYTTQTIGFPTALELNNLMNGKSCEAAFVNGIELISVALQIYLQEEDLNKLTVNHPVFELLPFYYRYLKALAIKFPHDFSFNMNRTNVSNITEFINNLFLDLGRHLLSYINEINEKKYVETKDEIISTIKASLKKGSIIDISFVKFKNIYNNQWEESNNNFIKNEKIKLPYFREIFYLIVKNCRFVIPRNNYSYHEREIQDHYNDHALDKYISDDPDAIEILSLILNYCEPGWRQVENALNLAFVSYYYRAVILLIGYHRKGTEVDLNEYFNTYLYKPLLNLLYRDGEKSLTMIQLLEDTGFNAKSTLLNEIQKRYRGNSLWEIDAKNRYIGILSQIVVSPNTATIKRLT